MTEKKRWYWTSTDKHRVFMFVSRRLGSATIRAWDEKSGISKMEPLYGDKALETAALLERKGKLLVLKHSPNVARDCNVRLPENILKELQAQLA